ncbi:hypothetical protein KY290_024968 [Solanum tuberosum]|uniref:DUF4283 domain-containing protein n=1 Tax=Solanum tuberosum TaxID=4113 RepID=A0ABQ7USA5_SOLTU|nr:hypothetical protein KY284_023828 [Solanum tuberosum]KAH0754698.1 hypothetical protein KY290_024968 [Solanum tuberosum]
MFDLEKETSRAIAWISFPTLPPNFFIKEDVFSLAVAVGKPLQVDLAMKNQIRPSCARVKVEVDLLELYPKKEGNDVADCARGKGDKDNKRPKEHPVERREIVQNIDEDVFKEQKKKKGGWERKMGQNKVLQVWNPKQSQKEKEDGITGNQFDALGRLDDEEDDEPTQGREVFREKEKIEESCGIKKKRDQSGSRKGDTVDEVEALDTSLTVDKANNEQVESEDKGSKVGNIGGGVPERMENKGSSSFFEEGINDLQEHSNEEIQRRGNTEEDGEVNANIDTIARDGDLSPRQINNLKSGLKKTVPYLPLQVKTRSNKDTSGGVSQ